MAPPRLVLVEGLPGSGKTAAAQRMCARLRDRGIDTRWFPESAPDHPVLPVTIRGRNRSPDYPELCLDAWASFVRRMGDATWVLEGCALQSTVRFMFEQALPEPEIVRYWEWFESIVRPVGTALVYLRPDDPERLLREHTIPGRSREWYASVWRHIASTPGGRRYRHQGVDGFVAFWLRYGELCDRLVAASRLRVQTIRDVLSPQ
ncbi:MAG: hypothetical protein KatS3mg009_0533 [Acidimicrobiia bacterium]|nr:MAG: hypothetical protein KatS3mg009_0533 [Acidimicrobiia bacterium]